VYKYEILYKKCNKECADDKEKLQTELKKIEKERAEELKHLYSIRNDMLNRNFSI